MESALWFIFPFTTNKMNKPRAKVHILSDSPNGKSAKWLERLLIIDSTTVSLFSNLNFKGVGRNPKTGKKKGGLKVHTIIHGNEGVPCDIRFTSAATHDHFLLSPDKLTQGDIIAMDRDTSAHQRPCFRL